MSRIEPGQQGMSTLAPVTNRVAGTADPLQVQSIEKVLREPSRSANPAVQDQRLQAWLNGGDLNSALVGLDSKVQREQVWRWYRQDTSSQAPGRQSELKAWLMDGVSDRLLLTHGSPHAGLEKDRLSLKSTVKELAALGKQQEALLFNVLGEIKGREGSDYLARLINRELRTLIPVNAMLDNLMRNTHKPDLES